VVGDVGDHRELELVDAEGQRGASDDVAVGGLDLERAVFDDHRAGVDVD